MAIFIAPDSTLRTCARVEIESDTVIANSIAANEQTRFANIANIAGNRLAQVFMRANHRVDGRETIPLPYKGITYHERLARKQHGATGTLGAVTWPVTFRSNIFASISEYILDGITTRQRDKFPLAPSGNLIIFISLSFLPS
jgi:hypothetical protein